MPPTVLVSKPAKRPTPWSSWTTKSPVRRSLNERSRPRPRRVGRVPARLDALQVVRGALAAAAVRPGDERRVAGADQLLQLGLALVQGAGRELGGLGAEL